MPHTTYLKVGSQDESQNLLDSPQFHRISEENDQIDDYNSDSNLVSDPNSSWFFKRDDDNLSEPVTVNEQRNPLNSSSVHLIQFEMAKTEEPYSEQDLNPEQNDLCQLEKTYNNVSKFVLVPEKFQTSSTSSRETASRRNQPTSSEVSRNANKAKPIRKEEKKNKIKSPLQRRFKGRHWTNNFLAFGKNPHFDWLEKKLGIQFIEKNPTLKLMKEKKRLSMEDYLTLYNMEDFEEIWQEFFQKGSLYRQLLLSRVMGVQRVIYAKFLYRYKRAFETGEFDHIAQ